MKQYPDSVLMPDTKKTFDMKAEPKPEEKVETKTAQMSEEKKEAK